MVGSIAHSLMRHIHQVTHIVLTHDFYKGDLHDSMPKVIKQIQALPTVGRIKANIAVQDARAKEAMAEYEKSILMALSEVETALMKWQASESSFAESQRAQLATEKSAFHAQRLYEAGLLDLAAVLDTQRAHMQSREALAEADGFRLRAAVDLRRAFAGAVSSD